MKGTLVGLAVGAALLIGAFAGAVVTLNATVYSPSGYVQTYVDALARKDAVAALGLAGPKPSSSAIDHLLTEELMADFEVLSITERDTAGSRRAVEVHYLAAGREARTEFELETRGMTLGLFPQWRFAQSPLVQLDLQVLHAREFTANGVRQVTPLADAAQTYLAFTPGAITFDHDSELLSASEQLVVFGSPDRPVRVTLETFANDTFVDLVGTQARIFLDECAAQEALYPFGCPFGQDIADRLASAPQWSILSYPGVALRPTSQLGEWSVPSAEGAAQIDVDVRSIFDGSVTPFTSTVAFRVGYVVTLVGQEVIVTPRLG